MMSSQPLPAKTPRATMLATSVPSRQSTPAMSPCGEVGGGGGGGSLGLTVVSVTG